MINVYLENKESETSLTGYTSGDLVASGDTPYDALCNLVDAINAEEVDTENYFLQVKEEV